MKYFRVEGLAVAAGGVLAIVLGACTQDFGAYERAGEEVTSPDDGGTGASRTTADGSPATGDAAGDAGDGGVCAACTTRLGSCSTACDKTYDDCVTVCKGSSRCRGECRSKRDSCRKGCQSECLTCAGDACARACD